MSFYVKGMLNATIEYPKQIEDTLKYLNNSVKLTTQYIK